MSLSLCMEKVLRNFEQLINYIKDGGGGHSIEDDKYISDSEASDDGDKKRKKPVKGNYVIIVCVDVSVLLMYVMRVAVLCLLHLIITSYHLIKSLHTFILISSIIITHIHAVDYRHLH